MMPSFRPSGQVVGESVQDREAAFVHADPCVAGVARVDQREVSVGPIIQVNDLIVGVGRVAILPEDRTAIGRRATRDDRDRALFAVEKQGGRGVQRGHASKGQRAEQEEQRDRCEDGREGHGSSLWRGQARRHQLLRVHLIEVPHYSTSPPWGKQAGRVAGRLLWRSDAVTRPSHGLNGRSARLVSGVSLPCSRGWN